MSGRKPNANGDEMKTPFPSEGKCGGEIEVLG